MTDGAAVVFVDESGYTLTPYAGRTWAPRGTVPVLRHPFGRWEKLSAISGVALRLRDGRPDVRLYFRVLPGKAARSGDVVDYLRQLSRHLRGEVIVVLDNAGPHHARVVRAWVDEHPRFRLEHLPPYCPELNPDEGVWNWSKTVDLAGACPADSGEMVGMVRRSLWRLQKKGDVLRWCLWDTDLEWGTLLN